MDIHITNKTNKSCEVAYIIKKVRQLFSKQSVRLFRRFSGGRYRQKKCSVLCCKVIDACTTSNDV